jgi:hypothetical protein
MNTKPIQEFIIQSEENLRISQAVAEALPIARQKMTQDFLTRLDARLKPNLTGWKFVQENVYSDRDWPTYHFRKPEWAGQYGLALQFGDFGQKMTFGVCRERDKVGDRPFSEELMDAIKPAYPLAETNEWWDALVHMESPAADWQRPDVLWRMHTDETFLDDVAEQLLELAKISEPIVDKLVQQYKK